MDQAEIWHIIIMSIISCLYHNLINFLWSFDVVPFIISNLQFVSYCDQVFRAYRDIHLNKKLKKYWWRYIIFLWLKEIPQGLTFIQFLVCFV